jgi:hypothetical protein
MAPDKIIGTGPKRPFPWGRKSVGSRVCLNATDAFPPLAAFRETMFDKKEFLVLLTFYEGMMAPIGETFISGILNGGEGGRNDQCLTIFG